MPSDSDSDGAKPRRRPGGALPRVGPQDLKFFVIDQGFRTGRTFLRGLIGLGWAYLAYLAIHDLAGQNTSVMVNLMLKAIVDGRFVVATGGMAILGTWAYVERRLRKRQIVRWHSRIKELEGKIDVNRTTSMLTVEGDTHPMDRGL